MVTILFKGMMIGMLVSAPMGPIGLLCIQRTLNKGRWHGFYTGIGAACSDVFYALLTCLGMGIVVDFIQQHQESLQIAGSLLLMLFGYYIYRSNPSKILTKPKETSNYYQDIVSSFFLTLSNPFIIFFFLALFARFGFIEPEDQLLKMITGLLGIVAGALGWWLLITSLVGKVRSNFNVRGLWLMNRIVGVVIMVLSLVGIIVAMVERI